MYYRYGYVIDFSTMLLNGFYPSSYLTKLISMLIGCIIIAFGAYFEVVTDVTMLPADGFARAISKITNKNFGTVKMMTDSSQAVVTLILELIFLGKLAGVSKGTIIGALLIGNIVKIIGQHLQLEKSFA